jgi:hypothetical protein
MISRYADFKCANMQMISRRVISDSNLKFAHLKSTHLHIYNLKSAHLHICTFEAYQQT